MGVKESLELMVEARGKFFPKITGYEYNCVEEYVLKNGRYFLPSKRPTEFKKGRLGECFKNAQQLTLMHPNISYVEGYSNIFGFPMYHAWNIDLETDQFIDVTWSWGRRHYVIQTDILFGVILDRSTVLKYIADSPFYGAIIDDDTRGWPLLRSAA